MADKQVCPTLSEEDLRAAVRELKNYVDVTDKDLIKIYELALRHAQERLAAQVPVRDIMTTTVITVKKETDIHEAARLLSDYKISGMPVVDNENRVVGVVSEADILTLAGMKKEHTFKDVLRNIIGEPVPARVSGNLVQDVMSMPALTTSADEDIRKVAVILDERRIKRLPVVDNQGKLIGIISRGDIVRAISKKV
jgi:CBS-domain-containing membrane protein